MNAYLHRVVLLPQYFATPVTIEAAELTATGLWYLRLRMENGQLAELDVTPEELDEALSTVTPASRSVDGTQQTLLVEGERIRLAYAHDPHFAVSLSGVEPLPHQLEAALTE